MTQPIPNTVTNGAVVNTTSKPNWGPENYSGNAKNTQAAIDWAKANLPGIASIGGWRSSGSVAASDHPKGKACDIMLKDYKSTEGRANGEKIANWFRSNPNAFGTKYVIYYDRIDNMGGKGWEPYSHPSGSDDTLQHRDHVHVSFLSGEGEFTGMGAASSSGDNPVNMAGLNASAGNWSGLVIIGIIGVIGIMVVINGGLS